MTPRTFFEDQLRNLHDLCPPFEAVGVGGSLGAGSADPDSDLDFFLLVPDDQFFAVVHRFPTLIGHVWPPVVSRRRGFLPEFGYQFTYVYPNGYSVDFVLNCPSSLLRTPMARKTRVTKDLTGRFTRFHQSVANDLATGDDYVPAVAAELLIELLRISKYARRAELFSLVHRLERLRLVLLAQERRRHGEPYCPHDADKWVARDFDPDVVSLLHATFAPPEPTAAAAAIRVLCTGILDRLEPHPELGPEFHQLVAKLRAEIEESLAGL
jgi:hypothetical protein